MVANEFLNKRVLKCTYDVTVDGGTDDTTYVIGKLPAGSLVTGGYGVVRTDFDDGADESTTISIGYTGAAAGFKAALAGSAYNGLTPKTFTLLPGMGTGADAAQDTAAELAVLVAATYILNATAVNVTVTLSNDTNFVAGKIDVYIEYTV